MTDEIKKEEQVLAPTMWSIPKSFKRTVRQMTQNQLRDRVVALSLALLDMRNANAILLERVKMLEANKQGES